MIGSLFGGMHDFFHSAAWDATRTFAVLFLLVLWAATVYWVWKDATRRIADGARVEIDGQAGVVRILADGG